MPVSIAFGSIGSGDDLSHRVMVISLDCLDTSLFYIEV